MDIQISTIKLYQIIASKTDKKTPEDVVYALQSTIKEEVKIKAANQIKDLKIDIIDRIGSAKRQTIIWVVGVGVMQLVVHYLFI
ncbi:hypothetical protein [Arcticibacter eurypsychrophilus]|uniref:hypothetical protein n=1 Tax=Arcticibacter eurypsychrophilus TaxID=1434752 RepID=UPI00084D733F|nr:hypothetical protein [Arcticibacter eurypsychrophilus]